MLVNKTKQKLRDGKPVFGVQVQFDEPFITEAVGAAGFDFILVDCQHSPIGEEKIFSMTRGFAPTESEVIVRVVWNETWLVNQALDMGADGVIIPLIYTADDVKRAVEAAKYPPMGVRSNGPRKTAHLGGNMVYQAKANEETIVWPQIETKEALDNIDEILQVEGIDGIMVGPSDLAYSLGLEPPDLLDHPKAQEAIQFVLDKCNEHGVPWGMFTTPIDVAEKWLRRGGKIVTTGSDFGYIMQGLASDVTRAKEIIASL